jgi:transposase
MSKQNRLFSRDVKQRAARLVLDQGYGHMEANRSVDVGELALCRTQQVQMERQGVTPQGKAITPDQQRIQNWRRGLSALSVRGPF